MPEFDYRILLAALAFMALLTTLKLTLTGRVTFGPERKTFILFHPIWLGSLAVMVPLVIGWYLKGIVSPWPPAAFAMMQAKAGLWGGIAAGLASATVDLWLFWTTATALICFTVPMAPIYEPVPKPMHKFFHLVNVLAGAFVLYKSLTSGGA